MRMPALAIATAVLLAAGRVASPAWASEGGAVVCGLASVLDLVADHVAAETAHPQFLGDTAIELQTVGDRAFCAVTVLIRRYDINDPHLYPETYAETRHYAVRRLRVGWEVEYGR